MEQTALPQQSQDVVIAGAGVAGLTAAVAALESGATVTVVDKAPDIRLTNTSLAGGAIAFAKEREMQPDARRQSADELADLATKISKGHCNPELIKTWRENIDDTLEWLQRAGLKLGETFMEPRSSSVRARGMGAGLNKQLLSIARDRGCTILFNTEAKKLLTDLKGRVIGLRAMTQAGLKDFMARAVVLATAGFQANQEMLMTYMGAQFAYSLRRTGSRYSTGDGHVMAREVGAKLINMNQIHCRQIDKSWVRGSPGKPGPRQLQPYHHYGIFVNKLGKRFIDEYGLLTRSNSLSCSIMKQPDAEAACIFDERIRQMMGKRFDDYLPEGIIQRAETVQEIAQMISTPYDTLKATIDEYNNAVRQGKTAELDVPRSDFPHTLVPPFYVIYPLWSGLNCTLGGPEINNKAEVVSKDDIPIPGLYAAGEMIGGFFFGDYVTTPGGATYYQGTYQVVTSSLSACLVFARIAGSNAAKSRFGSE